MIWIRRIASAPLLLLTFVCAIGAVRIFSGNLPDSSPGEGIMVAIFAVLTGASAHLLLRPDIRRIGGLSALEIRKWFFANPLGQAALLWLAAAAIMAAAPKAAILPGFVAQCVYSILSPWSATSEVLTPRGFGEAGMLFLLPMEGFPILLALSGIARWLRKPAPAA